MIRKIPHNNTSICSDHVNNGPATLLVEHGVDIGWHTWQRHIHPHVRSSLWGADLDALLPTP